TYDQRPSILHVLPGSLAVWSGVAKDSGSGHLPRVAPGSSGPASGERSDEPARPGGGGSRTAPPTGTAGASLGHGTGLPGGACGLGHGVSAGRRSRQRSGGGRRDLRALARDSVPAVAVGDPRSAQTRAPVDARARYRPGMRGPGGEPTADDRGLKPASGRLAARDPSSRGDQPAALVNARGRVWTADLECCCERYDPDAGASRGRCGNAEETVMNKLSLKIKLAVGFGSLLLILILLGGVGYKSAVTTEKLSHEVRFNSTKKDLTLAIQLAIEKQKVGVRDALLHGDMSYLNAARAEFGEKMDALRPLLSSEQSRALFASIQQAAAAYEHIADRTIELGRAGKMTAALDAFYGPDAQQARGDLKKGTTDLVAWYEKLKTDAEDRQAASDSDTKVLILSLAGVGLLIGIVVATLVVRSITGAIARMLAVIQEIAANNLATADMQVTSQDEIGQQEPRSTK